MADLTNLRLKVFVNPMRDDGVFVAEDKPLEPYPNCRGSNGEPRYPAVPFNAIGLGQQVDADLARRIVACVNRCAGIPTEFL